MANFTITTSIICKEALLQFSKQWPGFDGRSGNRTQEIRFSSDSRKPTIFIDMNVKDEDLKLVITKFSMKFIQPAAAELAEAIKHKSGTFHAIDMPHGVSAAQHRFGNVIFAVISLPDGTYRLAASYS